MATNRKKNLIIIASAVVLIIIIVLAIKKGKSSDGAKVVTENVQKRNLVETVSANGQIQPVKDVKISPYISGEVVDLYVKEGDFVKTGQKLAMIDPKIYISTYQQIKAALQTAQANEASSKAQVSQAEAQFIKAKLDFQRNEKLYKSQVISQSDYEASQSAFQVAQSSVKAAQENYKASQFQVKSAQAQLTQAEDNLNRTTIYAPNDGTVSTLSVEKGERVTGASQFSAGTQIMLIANLNNLEADVQVNENDIVNVALNDTALIEVDAFLNRQFKGIVTEIATSANTTGTTADQVTNFDVKIKLLKSSYEDLIRPNSPIQSPFRPGMSCTVEIQTKRADNALSVPIQAVTTRADSSVQNSAIAKRELKKSENNNDDNADNSSFKKVNEYVFVDENGVAKRKLVTTGIQNNMYIQILTGLKEGEKVISGPYNLVSKTLKDGDKVISVSPRELFGKK
ncbi:MAG: efflux RND transporter periplasmic adaptor subunit [Bacteroidales bacterium]|nr:efflux RND transporter periplasmic adaptor subunit [Bacteroidales bacterium]